MAVVAAVTALVSAGLAIGVSASASAAEPRAVWNLASVAQECARTAVNGRPGVVEVGSRLVDAGVRVDITVPCVIHLNNGASVALADVTLTTRTLNIHDRATGAAASVVDIGGSTITAVGNGSGVLVELDDAADRLNIARTTITAPAGFLARVAEQRGGDGSGGTINVAGSTVTATAASSAGIQIVAADRGGRVSMAETTLDTTGSLTVVAGTCAATRAGRTLNCSADQLARDLG